MPSLDVAFSESHARQFVESRGRQRDTPQISRWTRYCHVEKEMGGISSFLYFPQLTGKGAGPFESDRRFFSRWNTITDKVDYVQGPLTDADGNIYRNATDVHYTGRGERVGLGLHAISSGYQDIPHPGSYIYPPQLPQRFYRYGPPDPHGQLGDNQGAAWPVVDYPWNFVTDSGSSEDTLLTMHHTPIDTGDPSFNDADVSLRSELTDPTDCAGMFGKCKTDLKNEYFPVLLNGGPSRAILYNDGFGNSFVVDQSIGPGSSWDTQNRIPSLYDGSLLRFDGPGLSDAWVYPYLDLRVVAFSGWALSTRVHRTRFYLEPNVASEAAFGFPDLFLLRGQFGLSGYGANQHYWVGRCRTAGPSTGNMQIVAGIGDSHWLCKTEFIERGTFSSQIVAEVTFPDGSSPYPLQQIGDGMVGQDVIFFALGDVPTDPNDLLTPGMHFAPP